MAEHNELGKRGEEKAVKYLSEKGYVILERNWRLRHLELDLVCQKDNLVVIVEVKTRLAPEERPGELLDYRKRKNLRKAANAYIKYKGLKEEVRFDLILVTGVEMKIEHIEEVMRTFE